MITKGHHFSKVISNVSELSNVLDMEKDGEISKNLRNLYEYVLQRLLYANLNNDITAIEDSEKVIETLKSVWKDMMENMKQQQVGEQVGVKVRA